MLSIIDSHQHFWNPRRFTYLRNLPRSYTPEQLIPHLRRSGVAQTIVVQATNSVEETEWLIELTQSFDFIAGAVIWVDLKAENVREVLENLKSRCPKIKGIRHLYEHENDQRWILDEDVIDGLNQVAKLDLSYDLLVKTHHLKYIPELARQVPKLRLIIDHMAKPPISSRLLEPWKSEIAKLASTVPGVYCKVSGLMTEANWNNWSVEDLVPYVKHVISAFGFERLLWGSDWPVCLLASSDYGEALWATLEAMGQISDEDRENFLSQNATEFYRLQSIPLSQFGTGVSGVSRPS
jgi:L-fuconolactonase